MPITLVSGKITYTRKTDRWNSDETGVFGDQDFAVSDELFPLKQIKFNVSPLTGDYAVTLATNASTAGNITLTFPSTSGTLALVGSSGNNNTITFQTTSGTYPVLDTVDSVLNIVGTSPITVTGNSGTDTITIAVTGLSGTNTGDVTLAAIGASANANGASLSGQVLTLQPASASFGGVLTTGLQSINGQKTFTTHSTANATLIAKAIASQVGDLLTLQDSAGSTIGGISVAGYFRAPLGLAGTPSHTFQGDTNTGMYSTGADIVALTNGGSQSFAMSASRRAHFGANFTADTHHVLMSSANTSIPILGIRHIGSQTADCVQYLDSGGTAWGRITVSGFTRMPEGQATQPTYSFFSNTTTGMFSPFSNGLALSTNGTTRMTFNASGNVYIGGPDSLTLSAVLIAPNLAVDGEGTVTQNYIRFSGATSEAPTQYFAKSRGTLASPSVILVNDAILTLSAIGFDGTDFAYGGKMEFVATDTPGADAMPTTWNLHTSSPASQDETKRLSVDHNGNVRAYTVHNNSTANGNASQQDIRSYGNIEIVIASTTNLTATPTPAREQILRVGNVVTVSGRLEDVDINSPTTLTEIFLTPYIATGATTNWSISGTATLYDSTNKNQYPLLIENDGAGHVKIYWVSQSTTGGMSPLTYHYTYEVQ